MTGTGLYQVKQKDIKQIANFLTDCFYQDPLYLELVPDESIRKKILPVFFECYLDMAFDYCEIYADSPELKGIITVFDTNSKMSHFRYMTDVVIASLKFAWKSISIDTSMKTLGHFIRNIRFLTSSWEEELSDKLEEKEKLHIDFFAVRPEYQGKGIGNTMMTKVLDYSDTHNYLTTLETHNQNNVDLYEHYGFQMFRTVGANTNRLTEYCMIRQ